MFWYVSLDVLCEIVKIYSDKIFFIFPLVLGQGFGKIQVSFLIAKFAAFEVLLQDNVRRFKHCRCWVFGGHVKRKHTFPNTRLIFSIQFRKDGYRKVTSAELYSVHSSHRRDRLSRSLSLALRKLGRSVTHSKIASPQCSGIILPRGAWKYC